MESTKGTFYKYLKDNGIRQSKQRDEILDIFLKTERHLTAAEIYDLVREKCPDIGFATVYRAMRVICDAGLADEIEFGDGVKRFEHKYGHEHHDHLVCLECGKFVEAVNPEIERLQKEMAKEHGFVLKGHKMQLFGICTECGK